MIDIIVGKKLSTSNLAPGVIYIGTELLTMFNTTAYNGRRNEPLSHQRKLRKTERAVQLFLNMLQLQLRHWQAPPLPQPAQVGPHMKATVPVTIDIGALVGIPFSNRHFFLCISEMQSKNIFFCEGLNIELPEWVASAFMFCRNILLNMCFEVSYSDSLDASEVMYVLHNPAETLPLLKTIMFPQPGSSAGTSRLSVMRAASPPQQGGIVCGLLALTSLACFARQWSVHFTHWLGRHDGPQQPFTCESFLSDVSWFGDLSQDGLAKLGVRSSLILEFAVTSTVSLFDWFAAAVNISATECPWQASGQPRTSLRVRGLPWISPAAPISTSSSSSLATFPSAVLLQAPLVTLSTRKTTNPQSPASCGLPAANANLNVNSCTADCDNEPSELPTSCTGMWAGKQTTDPPPAGSLQVEDTQPPVHHTGPGRLGAVDDEQLPVDSSTTDMVLQITDTRLQAGAEWKSLIDFKGRLDEIGREHGFTVRRERSSPYQAQVVCSSFGQPPEKKTIVAKQRKRRTFRCNCTFEVRLQRTKASVRDNSEAPWRIQCSNLEHGGGCSPDKRPRKTPVP